MRRGVYNGGYTRVCIPSHTPKVYPGVYTSHTPKVYPGVISLRKVYPGVISLRKVYGWVSLYPEVYPGRYLSTLRYTRGVINLFSGYTRVLLISSQVYPGVKDSSLRYTRV